MDELTHLDVFSGFGGFALAARWAGFRTVGFVEVEPYSQRVIEKNFLSDPDGQRLDPAQVTRGDRAPVRDDPKGEDRRRHAQGRGRLWSESRGCHGDVRTVDGRRFAGVTLLTGGFPCQPFSIAGRRRGKDDDRYLWDEMLRLVSEAQPSWVVGENVAGLESMAVFDSEPPVDGEGRAVGDPGDLYTRRGPGVLDQILGSLEQVGYEAVPLFVPACAVDARHRRMRVFILAHSERDGGRRTRLRAGPAGQAREGRREGAPLRDPDRQPGQEVARGSHGDEGADGPQEPDQPRGPGQDGLVPVADPLRREGIRTQGQPEPGGHGGEAEIARRCRDGGLWLPEPGLGRVAHGVPDRIQRLRGLGNAVVPAQVYEILRAIAQIEMT